MRVNWKREYVVLKNFFTMTERGRTWSIISFIIAQICAVLLLIRDFFIRVDYLTWFLFQTLMSFFIAFAVGQLLTPIAYKDEILKRELSKLK